MRRPPRPDAAGPRRPRSRAGAPRPTTETGRAAEALAEAHLLEAGYRVEARNFRCRAGEIDRVAWDGEVLCFVEVRSRRDTRHGHPEETVDWRKQRRIARVASAYLQRRGGAPPRCRFDVVGVVLGAGAAAPRVRLLRGACELA